MIRAVAQLKPAVFAHLPGSARRRAVKPDARRPQVGDPQRAAVQTRRKSRPLFVLTQRIQHARQTVIAEIHGPHCSAQAAAQRLDAPGSPLLHLVQPVVRFRQNVRQPPDQHASQVQSLPVPMRRKVFIRQGDHSHALHPCDQKWNIVHAFRGYSQFFGHTDRLSYFKFSQKMSEP